MFLEQEVQVPQYNYNNSKKKLYMSRKTFTEYNVQISIAAIKLTSRFSPA